MTYINHQDNLARKNYGSQEDPAVDDSNDFPDYNTDVESVGLEDPTLSGGDEFVESGSTSGVEDLGNIPQDPQGIRQWLIELRDGSKITAAEYKTYLSQVNQAAGLSGQSREAALTKVTDAIVTKYTEQVSGENGQDHSSNLDQLTKDLKTAIDDIDARKNLTDDEKVELKAPLEKHLTEIKLAKDDPSKVDVDSIKADIEEAKTNTDEKDAYSPALKGLATSTDLSPEEVMLKAKAKGIDLDKIPNPPTEQLMNFLADLMPDLKEAFKKVETAISDRAKSIQDNTKTMNDISSSNHNKDTSDNCKTDTTPWQNLFDLKHFQDDKSKAVASAMQDLVKTLTPIFQSLYPGQEVKAVEDNSPAGWEKAQGEYLAADKIQIGGMTLDLINNSTGKMQSSTSADQDIEINMATIWYDGEGSGEWHPPSLQTYGDSQPGSADNEDTTSGVAWGFF